MCCSLVCIKCCRKDGITCCQEDDKRGDLPVDRGWAWVIILASAGMFGVNAGTYKCFGIIKLEILAAYPDCSQDKSLWILTVASVFSLIIGPLGSLLLGRFSHRTVGFIGATSFCTGLFLTAWAPNCNFFFFSFSTIYAIGGGFMLVVCFTSFATYFLRHRALAVGIMAAGSGVGGVVLPPFVTYLFENFSFRDSMILYSALCLHTFIFAALLRPMSFYEDLAAKEKIRKLKAYQPEIIPKMVLELSSSKGLLEDDAEFRARSQSQSDRKNPHMVVFSSDEVPIHTSLPNSLDKLTYPVQNNNNKPDLLGSAISLSAMPTVEYATHINSQKSCNNNQQTAKESRNSEGTNQAPARSRCKGYDWSIWIRPKVFMACMLLFFAMKANCLFIATTPSFARDHGVETDVLATIMAVTGACEIFCRIGHGWIADRRFIPAVTQLSFVLFLTGMAAFMAALLPGVIGTTILYSTVALFGSSMFSLLPIVIIELQGVENLPAVTGIVNVYQALAFIASTPVANALQGTYDTWLYVVYYVGSCFTFASLIGFSYSLVQRLTKNKNLTPSPSEASQNLS